MIIQVKGTPRAQPRAKARVIVPKSGGRPFTRFYTPKSADGFRHELVLRARAHPEFPRAPWEGPISLSFDAYFERPGRLCRACDPDGPIPHDVKPDRDNVEKSIMDALTDAGLWLDDCQVCAGEPRKWYAAKGCAPGTIIDVHPVGAVGGVRC